MVALLLYVVAAVVSFVSPAMAYIISMVGSLSFLKYGFELVSGDAAVFFTYSLTSNLNLSFGGDSLSGFFIIVLSLLSTAVSLYSIGYTRAFTNRKFFAFLFCLFVPSMYGVVLSTNVLAFLIFWETMSILSYFLVVFENSEQSARAGLIYAVMTHIGTAFIIALFLIFSYYTKSTDFATFKLLSSTLPDTAKNIIFVFAVIGFGVKAGIMPFHYWLPIAHPEAPSNVSAIMSGVMIKTGIYGIVRVCLDMLGKGSEWWGLIILVLGSISAVFGIMQAVMEKDIKRLLAYSSIENVGIILLGMGAALLFGYHGMVGLSSLALTASFYHILNHSLFKGLLFMGAGSVLHATGSKNMEVLGGLIKKMPETAFFFLIGAISICAFPPFNGFVSEWLTYQSLLLGYNAPSHVTKILSPLFGASLALTGAIAAAAFVKAFGITFLGMPRSEVAKKAHESHFTMTSAMGFVAFCCLFLGVFPNIVIPVLSMPVFAITGSETRFLVKGFFITASGSISTTALALSMLIVMLLSLVLIPFLFGKKKVEYGESWDCGFPSLTPRMQYTATAFTQPLRIIFKRVYMPKREVNITYSLDKLFVSSMSYKGDIVPFLTKYALTPLFRLITVFSNKLTLLQAGTLQLYLAYILITLVVLLLFWL